MDGNERAGGEGGRRWAKDQSGGRPRQLRTRCRQAVGRPSNGHQRSGARVRRTADVDLMNEESRKTMLIETRTMAVIGMLVVWLSASGCSTPPQAAPATPLAASAQLN